MGYMKQRQMDDWAEIDRVLRMLVEEGAVDECEIHEGVYVDADDSEAAERVQRQLQVEGQSESDAEMLVRTALDHAGMDCGYCAKNAESD